MIAKNMTNRFFVSREIIKEDKFYITEPDLLHQMTRVLRFKPGESLELLDNTGKIYQSEVEEIGKKDIKGKIVNTIDRPDAPKHKINLCLALLKRDNFELVLQKATELGVVEITPVITDHCIKKTNNIPERWQKIIREASEQSGRTTMPKINEVIEFKKAVTQYSPGVICFAGAKRSIQESDLPKKINLYIGPEGDFTNEEIGLAKQNKIEPVNLGSNILRAETAAIAAVALINL